MVGRLAAALDESDQLETVRLIESGKDLRKRINLELFALLESSSARAARHVLCLQYYQRIAGHALNVLSTVVTPLHKMDYTGKRSLLPEVKAKLSAEAERVEPA